MTMPSAEQFLQVFDWITLMQPAERRRNRERARSNSIDRMALRAMGAHENEAALCCRRKRFFASCDRWQHGGNGDDHRENKARVVLSARQFYLRHDCPVLAVAGEMGFGHRSSSCQRTVGLCRNRSALSFFLRRWKRHAGDRLDPHEMIVHLHDACDIFCRDNERLALALVHDGAPQFCDAVFDDDVDVWRPMLLIQRSQNSSRIVESSPPAEYVLRAKLASACIKLARLTMPTIRPARMTGRRLT